MALVDRRSKEAYGFEKKSLERLREQEVELSGKRVQVRDWVRIGTDFVYDGTLLVSDVGVEYFFPARAVDTTALGGSRPPLSAVDLGLIRVRPGESHEEVARELREKLGSGVEVFSKHALVQREIGFWARNTPIGVIFSIGTVMGMVIGVIICYQILFTDIQDHMAEYATLKAMGYGAGILFAFRLVTSVLSMFVGFYPWLDC